MIYPFITEEDGGVEKTYNIFSRLLKDRIIFLMGEINDEMANTIIAQLLYLNAQNKKKILQCILIVQVAQLQLD